MYLVSLHTCLNECFANITRSSGCYDVASYVDPGFLQMFLWEHFGVSRPRLSRNLYDIQQA